MSDDMWTRSVQQMKAAILGDNNMNAFFRKFEPAEDTGYAWTMDPEYKRYTATLDDKTGRIHSGSSFAMCVRCAVEQIRADDKENFAPAPVPQPEPEPEPSPVVVQGAPLSEGDESGGSEGSEEIQVVTPIE
jgi:hypothetical protein